MKKAIAIILLCIMAFTACAQPVETSAEVDGTTDAAISEETTVDDNPEPKLPEYDGNGAAFNFMLRWTLHSYDEKYVYAEEYDGEVVNDAIVDRNRATEDKLNVKITATFESDAAGTARKSIAANDNSFHAIWENKCSMTTMVTEGYLTDFNTLPYIDLDAPYWDKNAHEQLSVMHKLYYMPSDISMQNMSGARFMYFNKKLITDFNLGDPYDHFDSNTWTLDVVLDMIKAISVDLNGDGKMDREDQYGILSEEGAGNGNVIYFLKSAGIRNTDNNSEGIPEISFMSDKTVSVMEKCKEVLSDENVAITYERASSGANTGDYPHYFAYCRGALFTTDHFLFVQNGIEETTQFKDMASDYGIAPNPKYDEAQEEYHHRIDPYTTIMALPTTNTELEMTGLVLEYMSWMSSKTVFPAYYEITIKTKRARDDEAAHILDVIKASISYELSDIFDFGIGSVLWNGYTSGNLASNYAKSEKQINKKLEQFVEKIAAIAG